MIHRAPAIPVAANLFERVAGEAGIEITGSAD